jgi:hypothetical protein
VRFGPSVGVPARVRAPSPCWGVFVPIAVAILLGSALGPRVPGDAVYRYGIPAFLLLILALSFFRLPYHRAWTDSGGRMLTHVIPLLIQYAILYAARVTSSESKDPAEPEIGNAHSH